MPLGRFAVSVLNWMVFAIVQWLEPAKVNFLHDQSGILLTTNGVIGAARTQVKYGLDVGFIVG